MRWDFIELPLKTCLAETGFLSTRPGTVYSPFPIDAIIQTDDHDTQFTLRNSLAYESDVLDQDTSQCLAVDLWKSPGLISNAFEIRAFRSGADDVLGLPLLQTLHLESRVWT
jgi:hypothetical protein